MNHREGGAGSVRVILRRTGNGGSGRSERSGRESTREHLSVCSHGWGAGNGLLGRQHTSEQVTEQNGSLGVWPGTHKEQTVSQFNSVAGQSARVNSSPGGIVIRYSNVWHRGTPNRSSEVRFMLANYFPA